MSQEQDLLLYPFPSAHQLPSWKKTTHESYYAVRQRGVCSITRFSLESCNCAYQWKIQWKSPGEPRAGAPPKTAKPEGLEATFTPHPSPSPTPSSAPELAVAPGRRRDGSSRGDRACILSSATPAAAGRWSECSKWGRDGHTRGIRVNREQNSITTGHAHQRFKIHPLLCGSHIPKLAPDTETVPVCFSDFSMHLKTSILLSWTPRTGTKQAIAFYASDILRSFIHLVLQKL